MASDSLALDEDDDDALMDGTGMTNEQFGKVRRGTRSSLVSNDMAWAGIRHSKECDCKPSLFLAAVCDIIWAMRHHSMHAL